MNNKFTNWTKFFSISYKYKLIPVRKIGDSFESELDAESS